MPDKLYILHFPAPLYEPHIFKSF